MVGFICGGCKGAARVAVAAMFGLFVPVMLSAGASFSFPFAVFSHEHHPSAPFDAFAAGELGVVVPGYTREHLYTAYRWMDGVPMDAAEQAALRTFWDRKLGTIPAPVDTDNGEWFRERGSLDIPIDPAHRIGGLVAATFNERNFRQFTRCVGHGFRMAAERLRSHVARFGRDSREVREWALAQDVVFSNCSRSGLIPSPAPADLHPIIRRDRDYQIAAAHFNDERFEAAERLFRAITPDPSWPGGLWAPYMVGRSMLWQARQAEGEDTYRQKLRRARIQLESVLHDEALAATHNAARYLLIRILTATDQEAAARLLGLRLMSPLRGESRLQDLQQYVELLRSVAGPSWRPDSLRSLTGLGRRDDLTDWIAAFQEGSEGSRLHSFAQWRRTGSTAWLVAALSKARPADAIAPELLAAAEAQLPGPGLPSVRFYQAKLLASMGERTAARRIVNELLLNLADRPSSANRVAGLGIQVSESFAEALQLGLRKPAAYGSLDHSGDTVTSLWGWAAWTPRRAEDYGEMPYRPMVHPPFADFLNSSVPIERFSRLAQGEPMPGWLRQEMVLAAWARAVTLERWDLAVELASAAKSAAPETAVSMDELIAAPPESRLLVAQLVLLRLHGIGVEIRSGLGRSSPLEAINTLGHNWWWWKGRARVTRSPATPTPTDWTTPAERMQAALEWKRIAALGEGHDWLYGGVFENCSLDSPPPQCAEALYRVPMSKAAIGYWKDAAWVSSDLMQVGWKSVDILDRKFGATPWPRRYRFDSIRVEQGETWPPDLSEGYYLPYVRYPR